MRSAAPGSHSRRAAAPATPEPADPDSTPTEGDAPPRAAALHRAAGPDRPDAPPANPPHPAAAGKPFAHLIPADARLQPAPPAGPSPVAGIAARPGTPPEASHDGEAARLATGDGTGLSSALGADPTAANSRSAPATAAYAARPAAVPPAVQQVALHITRAAEDGIDRFTVQLKPAELGRISAQITLHDHHHVEIVISAQRADTLAALQRDAGALARALQDAGLHADAGSLSFQFQGHNQGAPSQGPAPSARLAAIALAVPAGADGGASSALAGALLRPGGIDLRV